MENLKYLNKKTDLRLVQLIDYNGLNDDGTIKPGIKDVPYDYRATNDLTKTYASMLTPQGLAEMKTYADVLSTWTAFIIPSKFVDEDKDGKPDDLNRDGKFDERDRVLLPANDLVKNAHAAGLQVVPFTLRNEPVRLASDYNGNPIPEYQKFFALGIDGIFSDFADTAVKARDSQ